MAEHTAPELSDADDIALGEAQADLDRGVGQWVSVVFIDGEEFDEAWQAADESYEAMAAYLTQWDTGAESDLDAATDGGQWGARDDVSVHVIGGLTYVLAVNHGLGYASLNRRPLRPNNQGNPILAAFRRDHEEMSRTEGFTLSQTARSWVDGTDTDAVSDFADMYDNDVLVRARAVLSRLAAQ